MLFAPRNNTVHPLPKAELPDNSIEKELNFCRLVSLAFGIPPIILLQVFIVCIICMVFIVLFMSMYEYKLI